MWYQLTGLVVTLFAENNIALTWLYARSITTHATFDAFLMQVHHETWCEL